jgi:hypothetical protein
MNARPAGTTTRAPSRAARTGDSGDMTPMAAANGSARTPADSGL